MTQEERTPTKPLPFGFMPRDLILLSLLVLVLCVGLVVFAAIRWGSGDGNETPVAANGTEEGPTEQITGEPTQKPMSLPQRTEEPTEEPTPTLPPTTEPTEEPTPTLPPTDEPIETPTAPPTDEPTETPTPRPTDEPTETPTSPATHTPTSTPTVTPTPRIAVVPTPTPTPAQLVYVQSNFQGHQLNIIKSDGQFIRNLHLHAAAPAWSPDGLRIVFFGEPGISTLGGIYGQGNGIWVIEAGQEQEPRQLIPIEYVKNIVWSPDGTKLAFETEPPGVASRILVVDANGGREISRFPGEQPAWSFDSQKLVIKACLAPCGLWLINFDGGGAEQLTFESTDSYPAWSPEGEYLVFASENRDDDWEIYRLRMSGYDPQGEPERLTRQDGVHTTPVFSPDGQDLYIRTNAGSGGDEWRIIALSLDGGEPRTIIEGIGPSNDWGLARPAVQ
jgi:Tol biopolymer transport system component